ncbi:MULTISPECIES: OmpW family protein [unclassified Polynucleobacter]|uniref:OmpW/AlkL family protein n=1 Tax=unclassified Polynucleobacter TaxID=2640945 RepID=UPI001BFE3889|nr:MULTISPECIES: OmpW family outer membrane protein [unclassified Polynucleobacter]MBU3548165.1 OmpW family protein [Polynucleobacter sp. P1-05-14]QWD80927.1 OmpW family protein [Polynucleobacter sp. MWH-S4W17]
MRIKSLVGAMAVVVSLAPIAAQAQAQENPWMVRVRAVDLLWQNGQSGLVQAANVKAKNQVIPEFDVSYFFTKNIAAELVLTWPQQVNITYGPGNANAGKITALPPSLLAQYHFTDLGAFKPYVGAGINYTIFGNRQNFPALGNQVQVDQSSVGFVGQVGMDYMLDRNWGLNVDVKYATMSTNVTGSGALAGASGKLTLNPWMPAVGVTYKF